jgi:NMD protein affecting ribosome stability and mRNA decay
LCAANCGTKLSIYNDHILCNSCYVDKKQVNKKIREIKVFMHDYQNDNS